MCPTKVPGLYGFLVAFFQKHQKFVKEGVITTCLHILDKKGNLAPFNYTYIAFIPNVEKPRDVTKYSPISLYNLIQRIIAKFITNKLKQILHVVKSVNQSAFIPNKLITDNIIIGYECLHKIRLRIRIMGQL